MQPIPKNNITKSYTIPLDLLIDILKIVLNNNLNYNIEAVNDKESSLLLQVSFDQTQFNHPKAKENIEYFLNDYSHFFYGSPNEQ